MEEKEEILEPSIINRYSGVDYVNVDRWVVKYKEKFNMKYLYFLIHEWLAAEEYCNRYADQDFPEIIYLERITPAGKEIWFRWRPNKLPLGPKNPMWRYDLDIDVHVILLKDIEVMHQGKKYKAHDGEVEVTCMANLIIDYRKAWEKIPLLKHFKKLLLRRLLKRRLQMHKDELYDVSRRLQESVKTYLKLETYLPEREGEEIWKKLIVE